MCVCACVRAYVCEGAVSVSYVLTSLSVFLQVMQLVFLGLYTFVILFSFEKPCQPSVYEKFLIGWIVTMISDEIRQVRTANINLLVHWTTKNNRDRSF